MALQRSCGRLLHQADLMCCAYMLLHLFMPMFIGFYLPLCKCTLPVKGLPGTKGGGM
jgi:hypothetical protein